MGVVSDLHGDDPNLILPRKFKNPGQAARTEALERVRVGSGFVYTHTGAVLAVFAEGPHHLFNVIARVHGAQPRKEMQRGLIELDVVIGKPMSACIIDVAANHRIASRDADDFLYSR